MARLIVRRGEALDQEFQLVRLPVRIGRGPQNDVVLLDPVKSVSRDHAELRLEGGAYVLVDLESENGVWVSGNRVPHVALEPNVVASIGPFRLTVEGDSPADIAATGATSVAMPAGPVPPAGPPPVRPPPPRPPAAARKTKDYPWPPPRTWMIGGGLAIVAVAVIVAVMVMIRRSPPPPDPSVAVGEEVTRQLAAATIRLDRNECKEALAENIEPALASDPANNDLLTLKRRAEECMAAIVEVGSSERTQALEQIRTLLAARECSAAAAAVTGLLAANPDDADAVQLKTEAESCTSPAAPVIARTQPPAQPIPPENGGLEPLPDELDRDYQVRVRTMRARYDEVVAISSKGPSPNAIEVLQALARDTPPRYLDVAARLAEARRAWIATAQPHLNEGRTLAGQGKWNEAIQKLNQARSIDPSLSIDADLRDIEAAKAKAAAVACEEARGFKNYNRKEEAVTSYRRVLALAQPDHPCYVMAKEYVDSFGR